MLPLATLALSGAATAGDAHQLLGAAQLRLGHPAEARDHLEQAVKLHAAAGNAHAEARDDHQLAGAYFGVGEYQRALDAQIAARDAALRDHDGTMAVYVDLARTDILTAIGDLRGAEQAVERTLAQAADPAMRVHARIRQGILHIQQGHAALARDPLSTALQEERATPRPRPRILEALHLNLSLVERKARAFADALAEIELAKQAGTDDTSYLLNRGLVLADMGKLDDARRSLEAATRTKPEGDASWLVPFHLARVAALMHDTAHAIASDRAAIDKVAALALNSGAFGPTVIANHREPHLHLIGLLAPEQRWDEVLEVVAAMDGQSLLDSSEASSDLAPKAVSDALPARPAATRPVPEAAKLVAAWSNRHLTILVPGGDRVWRLEIVDGRVSGADIGEAAALGDLARTLEADPGNADAGRRLGQAMLPDVPAPTRIELLVIGPLARAPLAALRIGNELAIARHPLVRVPGVVPRTPVPRASDAVIAIGDPVGDLPQAAGEARKLAAQLHGRALIGAEATRAAFAKAAGAGLLHIAAHTTRQGGVATLKLADGGVSLDDIARLSPAPRLVVLASCGAAAGRDDAGNGSLTTAFLDAGAETVVGTRWSIDDAEAAVLIQAFYAAGGDQDPVRALATAQLTSTLRPATWAAFEVFVARPVR